MLVSELHYLSVDVQHCVLVSDSARFVAQVSQVVAYYAFEWTEFLDLLQWPASPPNAEEQGQRPLLHREYTPMAEFVLPRYASVRRTSGRADAGRAGVWVVKSGSAGGSVGAAGPASLG